MKGATVARDGFEDADGRRYTGFVESRLEKRANNLAVLLGFVLCGGLLFELLKLFF